MIKGPPRWISDDASCTRYSDRVICNDFARSSISFRRFFGKLIEIAVLSLALREEEDIRGDYSTLLNIFFNYLLTCVLFCPIP